ncbi:integral membrane protein [Rutstroemia sp. NJR-2017a BBW]|nr:integral membrane protein [Rutstroemia sp. NJR-2017a BBW]
MQLPPPAVLSSFPQPNYTNPITRGPELLIITLIFFPIVLLVVGLRTFTRVYLSKTFGADDVFLLIAVLPTTACAVLGILADNLWQWNRHVWDLSPDDVVFGLKMSIVLECLFGLAVACTKISLLILVMRVMSRGTGVLKQLAIAGIIVVACEAIAFEAVIINNCTPISDYWKLSFSPQNCIDERTHILASGIINTLTDFFVFFLPIPTVFSLPIPIRQQVMLSLLFAAGLVVCASGTVRIYYAYLATSNYDRTWYSFPLWISSVLELYIGIICTALPATKPFFSVYLPSLFGRNVQTPASTPYRLSYNRTASSKINHPASFHPQTTQLSSISEIPEAYVGKTRGSHQLLPLSYLSTSFESRELEDIEDSAGMERVSSIYSFIERGPARLTKDSERSARTDRTSMSSFIETNRSPSSSRFASSLYELPDHTSYQARDRELRHAESQDVLIHAL